MSDSNWPAPTMAIVSGTWGPMDTFKLIPVTKECPYLECIYNPQAKVLAVIGTHKKETFHMVPKLDDNGDPVKVKGQPRESKNPVREQRVKMETYSEYYVMGEEEVENFLKRVTVNHEEFEYTEILTKEVMEDPSASPVDQPPLIVTP